MVFKTAPQGVEVVGVDPNPEMQPYAHETAELVFQQPGDSLRLVTGSAEALPLPDDSVDAAVCTLVLCSVKQPDQVYIHIVHCVYIGWLRVIRLCAITKAFTHHGGGCHAHTHTHTQVLNEILRVLRPKGCFAFLEHVYAPSDRPLLRVAQTVLNPLQQVLADECHLTRDTLRAVETAGFAQVDADRFVVGGLSYLGPHVAGVAIK